MAAVMVSQYRLWSSIHCLVSRRVGCSPGTIVLPILRMPALNGVGARPATLRDLRGSASCAFRCFGTGCVPDGFKPVFSTICFNRAALPASGTVSVRTGAAATSRSALAWDAVLCDQGWRRRAPSPAAQRCTLRRGGWLSTSATGGCLLRFSLRQS